MTVDEWRDFASHPCFIEARKDVANATGELIERHVNTQYTDAHQTHSHHAHNVGWCSGVSAFVDMVEEKCHAE